MLPKKFFALLKMAVSHYSIKYMTIQNTARLWLGYGLCGILTRFGYAIAKGRPLVEMGAVLIPTEDWNKSMSYQLIRIEKKKYEQTKIHLSQSIQSSQVGQPVGDYETGMLCQVRGSLGGHLGVFRCHYVGTSSVKAALTTGVDHGLNYSVGVQVAVGSTRGTVELTILGLARWTVVVAVSVLTGSCVTLVR